MKNSTLYNKKLFLFILFIGITFFGFGQEIVSFSSLQNAGCSGVIANDANLTATGICRGSGITSNTGGTYNSNNWTTAIAIDANDYLEWTMTPNAGYQIDLTTMDIRYDRSGQGPTNAEIQVDAGSGYVTVFTDATVAPGGEENDGINLTAFTGITGTITFRLYAFNANAAAGTFDIEEHPTHLLDKGIVVNGAVTAIPSCLSTTTWDGANWNPTVPDLTTEAIINGNYYIGNSVNEVSFSACSLTVNATYELNIPNGEYVEVENDVFVDGEITVNTAGAFVQNDPAGSFSLGATGTASVNKATAIKNDWFYYTYWSSPVVNETVAGVFPDIPADRRFLFNAVNYLDADLDDIDDDANDWQIATGASTLVPGIGYAATSSSFGLYPGTDSADFIGAFNTGDISTPITYNVVNLNSWNFIGNPYPSALDFDAFYAANSTVIDGVAYFWSQSLPPDSANPGNEGENFNQNDYATYTVGSGGVAGASGVVPSQYVPSAQGFFVVGNANSSVTFNNSMRSLGNNTNFYRVASSSEKERLWINLTSDNGVFNQVLVAYVNGATNNFDGRSYDAPRNLSSGSATMIYSIINGETRKFAIQGKDPNSLNVDEVISIGIKNTIGVDTQFSFSIAQLEGEFLNSNTIYLKDYLLDVSHNLSASDYTFTSEVGEFNDRFEIRFASTLSTDEFALQTEELIIVDNENGGIDIFTSQQSQITNIKIFDLLGRELQDLVANNKTLVSLNTLSMSTSVYIAKVTLQNGQILTKKILK